MDINHKIKVLLISIFIMISTSLVLIYSYSITNYPLSVYENIPDYAFVMILVLILLSIFVTIYGFLEKNKLWKLGLISLIWVNLVILLLPSITGYKFSAFGDHLTHIGFVLDIIQNGVIKYNLDNVYPVTNILASELFFIAQVPVYNSAMFIGPMFYIGFILYSYILSKAIIPKFGAVIAALTSSVLLIHYDYQLFPFGFALTFLPLFLFIYFGRLKQSAPNFSILIVLLIILMPFFHPIASLILTLFLFIMEIIFWRINKDKVRFSKVLDNILLSITLLSAIIFFGWIWQFFWLWKSSITNVFGWINLEMLGKPLVQTASENFNKLNLNNTEIFWLFIKLYGPISVYLGLSTLISIFILKFKDLSNLKSKYLYSLSFLCIFSIVLWLVDYIRPLTLLSSGRNIALVITMFPLFVGLAIYSIFNTERFNLLNYQRYLTCGIVILLTSCSLMGVLTIYPSPFTHQTNMAVDELEFDGFHWLIKEGDIKIKATGFGTTSIKRFADAIIGTASKKYPQWDGYVDDHFSYDNQREIGNSINSSRYMYLKEDYILDVYTRLYPDLNRFNQTDFIKLKEDQSANQIYNNGELDIWFLVKK